MAEPVVSNIRVKKGGTVVSETVVTDTTTNIRDVGLTGNAAVELAKVATFGGNENTRLGLQTVERINQQAGGNFNQLIGGAGRITDTAATISGKFVDRSFDAGQDFFARSISASDSLIDQAGEISGDILSQTSAAAASQFNAASAARSSAESQLNRVQLGGESPEDRNKTLMLLVGGVILSVVATGFFK